MAAPNPTPVRNRDRRVLCVGLVCLDVIHVVSSFPKEDTDQRSIDQIKTRGGNASNNSTVLSQLLSSSEHLISGQSSVEYFGTLADGTAELKDIEADFAKYNIGFKNCIKISGCICPNSCVILNNHTASRTIIHTNKNLPELTLDDFRLRIDPRKYDWIHFEGRNLKELKKMIKYISRLEGHVPKLSVEVEKIGQDYEELIPLANVVFISKEIARNHGATDKEDALKIFKDRLSHNAKLICAWGEVGAAAYDHGSRTVYSSDAFPPAEIVDTLGAGDTFNAAVICSLSSGVDLKDAIEIGCRVAGAKIGQRGYDGVGETFKNELRRHVSSRNA